MTNVFSGPDEIAPVAMKGQVIQFQRAKNTDVT
jgi:hypothetical protein